MAIRTVRVMGDPILRKTSKEVKTITPRLKTLIDDMFDTMKEQEGVGLAAPQVGILKRICVIDTGEEAFVLINPVVLETSGEQDGEEGCLSVPGKYGFVKRPMYVKVKSFNENMEEVIIEGEGLKARAILHEMDHLDGVLYVDYTDQLYNNGEGPASEEDDESEIEDSEE